MTRGEALYERWAPADSIWAPWQKPVLFTQVAGAAPEGSVPDAHGAALWQAIDTGWALVPAP